MNYGVKTGYLIALSRKPNLAQISGRDFFKGGWVVMPLASQVHQLCIISLITPCHEHFI